MKLYESRKFLIFSVPGVSIGGDKFPLVHGGEPIGTFLDFLEGEILYSSYSDDWVQL